MQSVVTGQAQIRDAAREADRNASNVQKYKKYEIN